MPANDWFPTGELEESYYYLMDRLKEKIGFDLAAAFSGVNATYVPDYSFKIPQIIPGSNMQFTSGFTVDVEPENVFKMFSGWIYVIRSFFLGMLVVIFVSSWLRILFVVTV